MITLVLRPSFGALGGTIAVSAGCAYPQCLACRACTPHPCIANGCSRPVCASIKSQMCAACMDRIVSAVADLRNVIPAKGSSAEARVASKTRDKSRRPQRTYASILTTRRQDGKCKKIFDAKRAITIAMTERTPTTPNFTLLRNRSPSPASSAPPSPPEEHRFPALSESPREPSSPMKVTSADPYLYQGLAALQM